MIRDVIYWFLPSTSPNQFNPEAMRRAINRMLGMNLDCIYFGHFGTTTNPNKALRQVSEWLEVFVEEAEAVVAEQKGHEVLTQRLLDRVRGYLSQMKVPDDHEVYGLIEVDMQVSSMGMLDYFSK